MPPDWRRHYLHLTQKANYWIKDNIQTQYQAKQRLHMTKSTPTLSDVLAVLKESKAEFSETYGLIDIGVFGSLARGEARPDSDVDIVVKMKKPDLFSMVHIKESLEEHLQCPVDIVRYRDRMNPFLKTRIEKDAIYA